MLLLNPGLGDRLLVAGTDQLLDSWEAPQEQRVQPVQWIPAGPEERAKGIRLRVQHDKVGSRRPGSRGVRNSRDSQDSGRARHCWDSCEIPRISGWARHSWD